MTDDRVCITHDPMWSRIPPVDRPRPCYRRGLHYAACENPDECRGCVPRSATHGYLCPVCHDKLVDALGRVEALIVHLRSIERPAQAIGERVDTSQEKSILVPDSWLAADGLMEALGAPPIPSTASIDDAFELARDAVNAWSDLDRIVNTKEGAKRSVVLVRRMQTALRRWPDSEAEWRAVPFIACPSCRALSLWRKAPIHYLDEILIMCNTEGCGYEMDFFKWLDDYRPVIEGIYREQDRVNRSRKKAS